MTRGICEECGEYGKIHIHHQDGNHSNDVASNRQVLCPRCHSLAHVELLIQSTGRPGAKPISVRAPETYKPTPWAEVRRQYQACFPRA